MKFIFFTDPHGRANNPISRMDDFPQTVLRKLRWTVNEANERDAFLICGGDWLNRPDTSPTFIAEIGKILKDLKNDPVYTVLGNHDIYGYNPDTFARTPLHILEATGFVQRIDTKPQVLVDGSDVVHLSGSSSMHDTDKEDKKAYYISDDTWKGEHLKIHVVHGFLTDHSWPHVECTQIDDILDTNADVILTGHEHSGFGIIKRNGKTFCNPGALLRVSAGIGDVNMTVRVALIDTESDDLISFINLPDSIALPSMEVIDRDKLILEKEHEKRMQQFFSSISSIDMSMMDDRDIFSIFDTFAKNEEVDDDVCEEVRRRLSLASEKEKR